MPERVVDTLEIIEVDVEHGQQASWMDTREGFLKPLPQQQAIGQISQGVMMRHMP